MEGEKSKNYCPSWRKRGVLTLKETYFFAPSYTEACRKHARCKKRTTFFLPNLRQEFGEITQVSLVFLSTNGFPSLILLVPTSFLVS